MRGGRYSRTESIPCATLVTDVSIVTKENTRPSSERSGVNISSMTWAAGGFVVTITAKAASNATRATASPRRPAAQARTSPSVSSCRITRPRLAPSERRIPISLSGESPREEHVRHVRAWDCHRKANRHEQRQKRQ